VANVAGLFDNYSGVVLQHRIVRRARHIAASRRRIIKHQNHRLNNVAARSNGDAAGTAAAHRRNIVVCWRDWLSARCICAARQRKIAASQTVGGRRVLAACFPSHSGFPTHTTTSLWLCLGCVQPLWLCAVCVLAGLCGLLFLFFLLPNALILLLHLYYCCLPVTCDCCSVWSAFTFCCSVMLITCYGTVIDAFCVVVLILF